MGTVPRSGQAPAEVRPEQARRLVRRAGEGEEQAAEASGAVPVGDPGRGDAMTGQDAGALLGGCVEVGGGHARLGRRDHHRAVEVPAVGAGGARRGHGHGVVVEHRVGRLVALLLRERGVALEAPAAGDGEDVGDPVLPVLDHGSARLARGGEAPTGAGEGVEADRALADAGVGQRPEDRVVHLGLALVHVDAELLEALGLVEEPSGLHAENRGPGCLRDVDRDVEQVRRELARLRGDRAEMVKIGIFFCATQSAAPGG